ncbi:hypothetical protein FHR75_000944 [Kineococcus radiotolerans]|uniref:DUF3152 domain-containing protein n=1 Tax=Kineococcus radiotolerans TaxID=131568 RepID=A0A7W4TJP7_KINRA|nr:DUF3152 domain-containing protein [Kineococcus radiotolerans]MBB2900156.1 hypothetical protein [Kineococcus radiotolerans]
MLLPDPAPAPDRLAPAPRRALLLGGLGALAWLAGCTGTPSRAAGTATDAAAASPSAPAPVDPPAPVPSTSAAPAPPPGLTGADVAAGVLRREVPQSGGGTLVVVPGSSPAPASARVRTVRVEVEQDLVDAGVLDPAAFAGFALGVLNDPRGWGAGGTTSFARTDGDAEIRLVLATPDTSAALCRPLRTMGTLSCRTGDAAVLTWYRWVEAIPDYGEDRTGYRQYVVNHEVGHALGHGHDPNPGPGRLAPVMMQQTKGLDGALPNPWPNP